MEFMTPGLQDEWLNHYITEASKPADMNVYRLFIFYFCNSVMKQYTCIHGLASELMFLLFNLRIISYSTMQYL